MKTCAQREQAFRTDLEALMGKHHAELQVRDDRKSYGLHSAVAVVITLPSLWDEQGNQTAECVEFEI